MKPGHCVDVWFSYQTSEGNISLNTVFSHTKAHYIFIPQLMTSLYFRPSLVGDMRGDTSRRQSFLLLPWGTNRRFVRVYFCSLLTLQECWPSGWECDHSLTCSLINNKVRKEIDGVSGNWQLWSVELFQAGFIITYFGFTFPVSHHLPDIYRTTTRDWWFR